MAVMVPGVSNCFVLALKQFGAVSVRCMSSKASRKPIRILEPGSNPAGKPSQLDETSKDEDFEGKISSEAAAKKLSSMLKALEVRKFREKKQLIYLEGRRLIEEALDAGVQPKVIFHTKADNIAGINFPKDTPLLRILYRDLDLWSELGTPQGIVGIFKQPKNLKFAENRYPISVICDNVRDPTNLGAIVRTVAAAGCDSVLATKGCVDVWNAKALRGGCGGHFKVPVTNDLHWDQIENHISSDSDVYVAVNNVERLPSGLPVIPYHEIDSARKSALIMGGETEGVSQDALDFVRKRSGKAVHIPLKNNVESLSVSVAAGVFLFHLAQLFEKSR